MQDKATFAVNSGAIDSKWQRSHAPVTGMRRPRGLVQRIPRDILRPARRRADWGYPLFVASLSHLPDRLDR